MPCRRCSECVGSDHHWIDAEDRPGVDFECKHCDAVAVECGVCEGEGLDPYLDELGGAEDEDDSLLEECSSCDGSGIIEVKAANGTPT